MSIYTVRLRNTSNALSPRVSSEHIHLQDPPKLFGVDSWIPQSGSEFQTVGPATEKAWVPKGCVELVKLTVDDIWEIADAGNQELQRLARNIWRGIY